MNATGVSYLNQCLESQNLLMDTFNAVRKDVFNSLYFMLGSHEDAQDALQVGFLHCWQGRERLAGIRNLRAWIWRVCLNAGRDLRDRAWRRRNRPLDTSLTTAVYRQADPADVLIEREQRERLQAALLQLRSEEQEVFLMRQNGELTFEEIAQLRGTPVATGKSLMRAAVRKLRRIVQEEEPVDSARSERALAGVA